MEKNKEPCIEEVIAEGLGVDDEHIPDAKEIIEGISETLASDMSVAFAHLDGVLYARIYDGEKYVFPLPFMLSEDADAEGACIALAEYSVRELVPLIITDVPRGELEFLCSVFPHVDAFTYEDDDDSFYVKVNNECDMLDSWPCIELDGIALDPLTDSDKERYSEICCDRELNKYWGYDVDMDNPSREADFYLETVEREFSDGVAITLAVREGGKLVGEATVYGFDYRGAACIAVRVHKDSHSRGIGSRATKALIELAKDIGLDTLRAEIMEENVNSIRMTSKFMPLKNKENGKAYFELTF